VGRITDILIRVRDILGDQDGDRWDDDSLLRRMNEALYQIAIDTEVFKTTAYIKVAKGQHTVQLPEDFIYAKGFLFDGESLPVYSMDEMTRIHGSTWRSAVSTEISNAIQAVVTERQDARTVRVYPIPMAEDLGEEYVLSPSVFGVTTDIPGYAIDSPFGVVSGIYDPAADDTLADAFGVLVNFVEVGLLGVEYIRRPTKLTTVNEDDLLDLPEPFDTALVKYLAGSALRSNINAANRAMGNEELALYGQLVAAMRASTLRSNGSVKMNNTTLYNGMG